MPSIVLLNQKGQEVGNLELAENIFAVEEHQQAVFDTIIAELAGRRQGTQKAKTRTEVRGGGKKPWRQKGTGRARQGSIRAPQWRGGGVVFAPTPRSYAMKVNKKVVKLAMKCALSEKVRENALIALDKIELESFKTKGLLQVLDALNVGPNKIIVVLAEANGNVELAGRNIPYVQVSTQSHTSVYQMMNADTLVVTKAAIEKYEEVLK
jgi:large subunit ribosomal protein L4